jgi:glucose/arabinose dehydrogenase
MDVFVPLDSGGLHDSRGLVYGPDGNLYVVSRLTHSVLCYHGVTGAFLNAFVPTGSGGLHDPRALTFGPDDHLYVGSFTTDSVIRYDGVTGTFIDAFVPAGRGGLAQPRGLGFGPDRHLYIAAGNNTILRYDGTTGAPLPAPDQTGAVFVPAGRGGLTLPISLVFGPEGNLYVSDRPNDRLLRYAATTGAFLDTCVPAGCGGLEAPNGVVFGADGHLYVNSSRTNSVVRYHGTTGGPLPARGQTGAAFVPPGSGGLNVPAFLTFTPES